MGNTNGEGIPLPVDDPVAAGIIVPVEPEVKKEEKDA
jgi:hypothetical protein